MDAQELINKSLEDIETLASDLEKGLSVKEEETVSKAIGDEDKELEGGDVSNENPEEPEQQEEAPAEGTDDQAGEGEADVDTDEEEETEKSLESELKSNESVQKALEVSEFLQELVKSLDKTIADTREGLSKSFKDEVDGSNMNLAKSVGGIVKSQHLIAKSLISVQTNVAKSLADMDAKLDQKLDQFSKQSMTRKSISSATQPVNKSFEASLGQPQGQQTTNAGMGNLSKSQVSAKLMQEFEKGNSPELMNDILAFDSLGDFEALSPEAKNILANN